jgi:hypothetical protein
MVHFRAILSYNLVGADEAAINVGMVQIAVNHLKLPPYWVTQRVVKKL